MGWYIAGWCSSPHFSSLWQHLWLWRRLTCQELHSRQKFPSKNHSCQLAKRIIKWQETVTICRTYHEFSTNCEASINQDDYNCNEVSPHFYFFCTIFSTCLHQIWKKATDKIIDVRENGWAYSGRVPSWAVFKFTEGHFRNLKVRGEKKNRAVTQPPCQKYEKIWLDGTQDC